MKHDKMRAQVISLELLFILLLDEIQEPYSMLLFIRPSARNFAGKNEDNGLLEEFPAGRCYW
ncbi:hypothetical protein B9D94_22875 [Paenibacillus sp. Cedars]|nr:hypothetical protein B9D94_22875 [Paenibacillus sp. Cedars]